MSLVQYRADTAESEAAALNNADAAGIWIEAHQLHCQLHNDAKALRCARNALQCAPGEYNVHYQLGLCLLGQSQFAEAELHLRWCLQRTPDDPQLENQLREALKGRFDQQRRAAKEGEKPVTR
jgi:predicted Zn-dependent protease